MGEEIEWPDEGDESAFLSGADARNGAPAHASDLGATPVIGDRLPALDELVSRVPQGVRDALDELFRAKFTGVRRFPPPRHGG